tara:strand:- start:301 stop:528 length:228 start_codon:yes stop_codon:yes gene_type:complete
MNLSRADYFILLMIAIVVIIGAYDLYTKNINTIEPLEHIDYLEVPETYERMARARHSTTGRLSITGVQSSHREVV